jgi:hypothetical protein
VSGVLTSFLAWPLLLAWLLPPWVFWADSSAILGYLGIILVTGLTTTTLATFCSTIFRKTSVSLMTTYLVLAILFALPVAAKAFLDVFHPAPLAGPDPFDWVRHTTFTSPLAAALGLPLSLAEPAAGSRWWSYASLAFMGFYLTLDAVLLGLMLWIFNVRWRVRT